ncbi:MAG: response regulator, partial [Acidobacteria bacterium]|nr:response regulator [Acidobacteriota bacterium]
MNRMQHIAVIDDERESLAAISRALRRVGYRVDSYEDSQAAMAQLDRFKQFDLVITDLKMPRVSGMELLRAVRSVNPEAGVLMVTGHGTVETAVEAMRLGADDYILKPLDLFELRDRVRQILESRAPGAPGRDPAAPRHSRDPTRNLGGTPAL